MIVDLTSRPRGVGWHSVTGVVLAIILTAGVAAADGSAAVVRHGRTDRPEIALTIDDGYATDVCRQMVQTLRTRHVPATFFPIGKNVAAHPRFWRGVATDFPIGNHTQWHAILPKLSAKRIRKQIQRDGTTVRRFTGKPVINVLRPPGGALDARVRSIAASLGYPVLLTWDVDSKDTVLRLSAGEMLQAALGGRNGSVILMHCNHQLSANLLPHLIRRYRQRGFRFVTIPQLLDRAGYPVGALRDT